MCVCFFCCLLNEIRIHLMKYHVKLFLNLKQESDAEIMSRFFLSNVINKLLSLLHG